MTKEDRAELMGAARDLDECADWWRAQNVVREGMVPGSPVDIRVKRYRARAVKLREIAAAK